ncbi:MAG: hypothetical protein IJU77_06560 [Butyrivibrio sp.]|nr:hypothetical protein [Butyrivibrio sp.]
MKKTSMVIITLLLLSSLCAGFLFAGHISPKNSISTVSEEEDSSFSFSSLLRSKDSGSSDSTVKDNSASNSSKSAEAATTEAKTSNDTASASTKKANPIAKAIVSETIETIAEQKGGTAKEIAESMSAEDKAAVTEIIAANVSLSDLPKVQSYVNNNDSASLMAYAEANFPQEDVSKLKSIMSKYQSQ